MREDRQPAQAYTGGMVDRVEDRGRGRDQRGLADPLGTVGAEWFGVLDEQALDLRDVTDGGEQVIVQVLGAPRHVFFHQRESEPLCDAALDLPLHQGRVDRGADVVGGDDAVRRHRTQLQIDLHARHLRREPVGRVRDPLAVLVERGGRGVEGAAPGQHHAIAFDDRQVPECDRVLDAAPGDAQHLAVGPDAGVRAHVDQGQDLRTQVGARALGRTAGGRRSGARPRTFPRPR